MKRDGDGRGEVVWVGDHGEGQAAAEVDVALEQVSEGMASLHAGVPHERDAGRPVVPGASEHRARGLQDDDGARVHGGQGMDEGFVVREKTQVGPVAAGLRLSFGRLKACKHRLHDRVVLVGAGLGACLGLR